MRQTADNGKPFGTKGTGTRWVAGRIIYRSGVAAAAFVHGLGWAIRSRLAGATRKRYRRVGEQANAHAPNERGLVCEEAPPVRRDPAAELAWRRKAAEQGDANAQYYLGRKYEIGLGVPQDFAHATQWYVRAAEQGNARAQEGLANMYAQGRCVPRDNTTAAYWHRRITEQKKTEV